MYRLNFRHKHSSTIPVEGGVKYDTKDFSITAYRNDYIADNDFKEEEEEKKVNDNNLPLMMKEKIILQWRCSLTG